MAVVISETLAWIEWPSESVIANMVLIVVGIGSVRLRSSVSA